jgi:putative ABC transport system permease protein
MIRNYLTIAWRNMMRQKLYTLINIFGLAVGTATFILVIRFVQDEFSYDRWHTKGDRIYNILRETRGGGKASLSRGTSGGLTEAIRESVPEVEQVTRVQMNWSNVELDGNRLGTGVWVVDPNVFLDIFDYLSYVGHPRPLSRIPVPSRSLSRRPYDSSAKRIPSVRR